jgi:hypothetical protein
MQGLRHALKITLPIAGTLVAFSGVLFVEGEFQTLMTVLAGILIVEAGAWNLAGSILPPTRRYHELRSQVLSLVARVPELNRAALRVRTEGGGPTEEYRMLVSDLHAVVDRMAAVAGKAAGDRDIEIA